VDKDKASHGGMLRYGNEPMALWGTCQGRAEPEWIATEVGFAIPREFKTHLTRSTSKGAGVKNRTKKPIK
jgi:acetyl-CoA carboxylase alpha subunit